MCTVFTLIESFVISNIIVWWLCVNDRSQEEKVIMCGVYSRASFIHLLRDLRQMYVK